LPQKLLSELEPELSKLEQPLHPNITWIAAEDPEESVVQVCWKDGEVHYARTKMFTAILNVLETYASSENSEETVMNEVSGEEGEGATTSESGGEKSEETVMNEINGEESE
jgi:hypothetical protein